MRRLREDSGQTSVFIIGVTVVILLFALTIAAITSVTLQHRKLLSLADSAAQTAATGFTLADPQELSISITQETATRNINQHFEDVAASQRFTNLQILSVRVAGDTTVTVELAATANPPIVNWLLPSGVQVVAEGTARTQLAQ